MKAFAELLDRLVLTPSRNAKLKLLVDYIATAPDPDRGHAIAAITRDLDIMSVKPAMIRALAAERVDEILFGYSYDFVGDLAETVSLIWPAPLPPSVAYGDISPTRGESGAGDGAIASVSPLVGEMSAQRTEGGMPRAAPRLSDIVEALQQASRSDGPKLVETWLDALDPSGRYALLKLITGGMRIGVSSRLMKQALADYGGKDVAQIEELWHGLTPPYLPLFQWLDGKAEKPENLAAAPFRPVMLATPTDAGDLARHDPADYLAEWKWDGIRVQATAEGDRRRIYSRTGDDISAAFPDLLAAMEFEGSLDGELLVGHVEGGAIVTGTFSDLQQRLNRKTVPAKLQAKYPVILRAYDLLQAGPDDLRSLVFEVRRERLERFVEDLPRDRFDLSPLVPFDTWEEVAEKRNNPPDPVIEGVMLKRRDFDLRPRPPERPVVQVEARSLSGRRRADVCPARPRQALELLFRLYLRRLDRPRRRFRPGARRQGLFRLHRRGAEADRQVRARQHRRALRSGALGARRVGPRAGAGSRLRGAESLDAAQVRRRHALSRASPGSDGTSRPMKPTGWKRWRRCWIDAALAPAPISA